MYRPRREQRNLFSATTLLPDEKRQQLERTWAGAFREKALPLIKEDQFRHLFHADNGRPNKPVQTVIGLLILKEIFELTDEEALFNLSYHMAYHVALGLDLDEANCCQKTLHNFRVKLILSKTDVVLFKSLTDQIIKSLGVDTGKQRLDSTHIVSNIARLTRLGLFCETIRVFLCALKKEFPKKFRTLRATQDSLRKRYLKDDGTATRFGDAASKDTRRRLSVCARDVWRLVDFFRGDRAVGKMEAYQLLKRLLNDQCDIVEIPKAGDDGDADVSEPGVPVEVKEPEKVSSDSLQTPHDPDMTYSGHKGKGYEVQIAETHGNEKLPEIITHVELTQSCDSDEVAAIPTIEALASRQIKPRVMVADTTYCSTANVIAAAAIGTELLGPVSGKEANTMPDDELGKGDFFVDPRGEAASDCVGGQLAVKTERDEVRGTIRVYFNGAVCDKCQFWDLCPARRLADGTRVLSTTVHTATLQERRAYEQTDEFSERYAPRAGIEATNSELKRAHGLGRIRTQRRPRIRLAVYLKAAACNVKRMVNHVVKMMRVSEKTAELATVGIN